VIAGQGTIGLELLDDRPDLDHLLSRCRAAGSRQAWRRGRAIRPSIR
jgi:hypothetical protein